MPLYDCRLPRDLTFPCGDPLPGAEPFPRFAGRAGRLYDAAGNPVQWVVWCDTDTGELERYDRRDGRFQIDPATKRLLAVRETRPAPLEYRPPEGVYTWDFPPDKAPTVDSAGSQEYPGRSGAADAETRWYSKNAADGGLLRHPGDDEPDRPLIVGG